MKDRYLFPRKIRYEMVDMTNWCRTSCPFGFAVHDMTLCYGVKVGSKTCSKCEYYRGDDEKNHVVLCVRKPKKGGK